MLEKGTTITPPNPLANLQMNSIEYPTKYNRQCDVLYKLWFAFSDAHSSADWELAAKLGKRYYRAKRWCQSHGFKF